jgi:hypothetical protein
MKNMKNMKNFSVVMGGKTVRIAPDYHTGGRGNGPIGWVCQPDGTRTGVAVSVGRNWQVCQGHAITWSDPLAGDGLTAFAVNGQAVSAVEWDRQLADECY